MKLTVKGMMDLKGKRQITCTTCHDYFTAKACDEAGVDMFVTSGEFIRQYIAGDFVRTNETMQDLLTALEGVRKGAPNVFIYASIPHGTANVSEACAVEHAWEALRNGADAVYYSGASLDHIRAMRRQDVPVVGHAGMIPWRQTWLGGCHAVGKTADGAYEVYQQALAMQEAGCFAIELECVPSAVAAEISKRLDVLTISMGSGYQCDGQYMFSHDMLGQHTNHYPRHSVVYERQHEKAGAALKQFVSDVTGGALAQKQKLIDIPSEELEKFQEMLAK